MKNKRNYTLSLKKTDSEKFKMFLENQSNLNETLHYLIYQEIVKNGVDDISYKFNQFINERF